MTRTRLLEERKALLLTRCDLQRESLGLQISAQSQRARQFDQGLAVAGKWTRSPAGIGIAVLAVLLLTRARSMPGVVSGLGLLGVLARVMRITDTLARRLD